MAKLTDYKDDIVIPEDVKCFFCSEELRNGGFWSGNIETDQGNFIFVCKECITCILGLTLDTMEDTVWHRCANYQYSVEQKLEDWLKLCEKEFWKKQYKTIKDNG